VDPRYAWERFTALKVATLDRTLLAGGRRAVLVGTGASLDRWRAALGDRVAETREARMPDARVLAGHPPFVLVYVSPAARKRWRARAATAGWEEMKHFIFIS
jgi:hypothetical protein